MQTGPPPQPQVSDVDSLSDLFARGRAALDSGDRKQALAYFRAGREIDPANAQCSSYYGLCIALVDGRFNEAVDVCSAAVKAEFFNPDLYCNLARVHLAFGFKAEGLRYLRRGLMIDPAHDSIKHEIAELGRRGSPPIGFLPRKHVLNRWLGAARHLVGRSERQRMAA